MNGPLIPGTIRDLGMGGCCIENLQTVYPFDLGTQTEILVKVNSWFFRAMAHVKAVRGPSGISVEFMRMSPGGYDMLADLIAHLDRPRIGVIRQKRDTHSPQRLSWNAKAAPDPNESVAIVGTIVTAESAQAALATSRRGWDRYVDPEATAVDLFV